MADEVETARLVVVAKADGALATSGTDDQRPEQTCGPGALVLLAGSCCLSYQECGRLSY